LQVSGGVTVDGLPELVSAATLGYPRPVIQAGSACRDVVLIVALRLRRSDLLPIFWKRSTGAGL